MMTKFNAEPCLVVNITGPEVTVQTKDGGFICRNKSYEKKIPTVYSDDDDDEDERPHDRIEESSEAYSTNASDEDDVSNDDIIRRSSRNRNPPERYGFPVPSEIVEEN